MSEKKRAITVLGSGCSITFSQIRILSFGEGENGGTEIEGVCP